MSLQNEKRNIILAGLVIGVVAAVLVFFGNPANMGFAIALLAECAGSKEGKAACLRIHPISDLDDVKALLAETSAASNLAIKKGYPGFSGVSNVSASLERAERGGSLHQKICR